MAKAITERANFRCEVHRHGKGHMAKTATEKATLRCEVHRHDKGQYGKVCHKKGPTSDVRQTDMARANMAQSATEKGQTQM